MFDPNWDSEASEEYQPEPLLEHNAKRFVLFPIKYSSFWNLYKNCQAKFWSAVEAELDEPIEMNRQVSLVIMALSLLAINDDSLSESAVSQISSDIQSPEARCFFGFQIMQRTIHTEALTMALDRLTSEIDRDDMVSSVASISYIGRKSAWVQRYLTDSVDHFSLRIVSLAVYNKIVQSALIDLLLLLQGKLFPGLFHLVAKIRADHQQYFQMCLLVQSQLTNRPSQEKVNQMLAAAVEAEKSLLVELKELSGGRLQIVDPIEVSSMNQRIEAEADSLLLSLGYSKLYNTKDPLAWINEMADKEARKYDTIEIQKPKASAVMQKSMSDAPFSVDEDF